MAGAIPGRVALFYLTNETCAINRLNEVWSIDSSPSRANCDGLTEDPIYRNAPAGDSAFSFGDLAAPIGSLLSRSGGSVNVDALGQGIDVPDDLRAGGEIVGPL